MENELKSIGRVVELNDDKAVVIFKRSKSCGDCKACPSFGNDEAKIEIRNTLGAKPGDKVELSLHTKGMASAMLIIYGIPLLALMAGVYFGCKINDLWGAVIGIAAAVITLVVIHLFEPAFKRSGKFEPKMTRVISDK